MRVTWKSLLAFAVVLMLAMFLGAVAVHQAAAQAKGPEDFAFPDGAMGKVVFSHAAHLGKDLKCTSCHTKIFKMNKGQRSSFKMADMQKGQACGACHNGKTAFAVTEAANCAKCHKKG